MISPRKVQGATRRDTSYYKTTANVSKATILNPNEKIQSMKNIKRSYGKLKSSRGLLKYRLHKNNQHKEHSHYTSKRESKRAKNTPCSKYSSRDYLASRTLKTTIFKMKKNSFESTISGHNLMDATRTPVYSIPVDLSTTKGSGPVKGAAVGYATELKSSTERLYKKSDEKTKQVSKIREKIKESARSRKRMARVVNSTRFIKFDLRSTSHSNNKRSVSKGSVRDDRSYFMTNTPEHKGTKFRECITSPQRPPNFSDSKFLSPDDLNGGEYSDNLEKEELALKLAEANTEIARLKLELEKERNLREMQVCKLCSLQKVPESGRNSIAEYINNKLQKYKKEYEDDLLFQKLENDIAEGTSGTSNKSSTAHCSSAGTNQSKLLDSKV
ncbi:unnamed protein product [Moneuplotes crassus]|uniref:Uncharacterized protein n=1 Tax=Euplotes crassus TaxID=5936 RepID=A0AAD1XC41_EUPCR|nr:unnamed protein product [Moneuplotes crassus]